MTKMRKEREGSRDLCSKTDDVGFGVKGWHLRGGGEETEMWAIS